MAASDDMGVERMSVPSVERPLSTEDTKLDTSSTFLELMAATDVVSCNEDTISPAVSRGEVTSNVATSSTGIRGNTSKGRGDDKGSRKDSGISVQDSSGSMKDATRTTSGNSMKEIAITEEKHVVST